MHSRLILILTTLASALAVLTTSTLAAPGELDLTFDGDGKLVLAVDTNAFAFESAQAVLAQPDGKTVVVGDSDGRIVLARVLTNGALDPAFGTNGTVLVPRAEEDFFYVLDAALQADGKTLVCGQAIIATNNPAGDPFVARFLTNGAPDASFGDNGLKLLSLGIAGSADGIAVQPDGRIVLAIGGYDLSFTQSYFAAMRLLTNGAPDPAFDGDGYAETTFPGNEQQVPNDVVVQSDGRIVLAGYLTVSGTNQIALARFNANGTLDTGFGASGRVTTSLGLTNAYGHSLALQPDGGIVVGGAAAFGFDDFLLAARYTTNGAPDTTFGAGGLSLVPRAWGVATAVQPDGKIIVVGTSTNDVGLFRFTAAGALDATFGNGGRVQTQFSIAADSASDLALQADGRIVVAGSAFLASADKMIAARYLGDDIVLPGTPPTLTITPATPGFATVSWTPPTGTNWILQERLSLSAGAWTNSPSAWTNPAVVPVTLPTKYFRLFKP